MLRMLLPAAVAVALLCPAAWAEDLRYKVIYLNFDASDVAEGKKEPIVMEDGLLLSESKRGPAIPGCEPMKPCYGTFEVPILSDMLNAMFRKGWGLVSIQPVTEGELKGGYLAFLERRP